MWTGDSIKALRGESLNACWSLENVVCDISNEDGAGNDMIRNVNLGAVVDHGRDNEKTEFHEDAHERGEKGGARQDEGEESDIHGILL